MSGFGISGIARWALKTADIERLLKFYRDTLGFTEMMRLHHEDGRLFLIYLRITDTQYLELFPEGEGGEAPDERASAVNHICLEVENIAATAAALTNAGIALHRAPKLGLDGNNQCWIMDPDSNRIEFMQLLPGNMQWAAIERLKKA